MFHDESLNLDLGLQSQGPKRKLHLGNEDEEGIHPDIPILVLSIISLYIRVLGN